MGKRKKLVFISKNKDEVEESTPASADSKDSTVLPVAIKLWKTTFPVLLAIVVAFVSYFIAHSLLPKSLTWWLLEICSMILTFVVLAGLNAAMRQKLGIDKAIAFLVVAIFLFQIIQGYSENYKERSEQTSTKDETAVQGKREIHVPSLHLGANVFHLDSVGEETSWLRFPNNMKVKYKIGSSDYGYNVVFSDGKVFAGDPKGVMPATEHAIIKLIATKPNQFITVTLTLKEV